GGRALSDLCHPPRPPATAVGGRAAAPRPAGGGPPPPAKVLWLSGRYDSEVYAIDTVTGKELARIPVGDGPHGLAFYPQPGRYSLGHTGVFR
ncbi:YncE family protein, partial [Streptomyces sp. NPDC058953]|uniref:YncE family protein n=1 Tax=Streptomyces sp. NPDC058953 TaxID=3346676 RepID=UPI0036C3183D